MCLNMYKINAATVEHVQGLDPYYMCVLSYVYVYICTSPGPALWVRVIIQFIIL